MSAVTLPSTRSLCWHEAAHASSLILGGLMPLAVRVDWPTKELAGSTKPPWEDALDGKLVPLLIGILAAPLSEGETVGIEWPPDLSHWSEGCAHDARHALFVVELLDLHRVGWLHTVWKTQQQLRSRSFRTLQVAVAQRLEQVELILRPELVEISERVLEDA